MRTSGACLVVAVVAALCWTAPAAEARPLEITSCGRTITRDARLATSLTCTGSSGIVVGRRGITIDLGGHTLTGNSASGHYGVDDTVGFRHVTVENGTITRFEEGIDDENDGDGLHVSGVRTLDNSGNGVAAVARAVHITRSEASGNALEGFDIKGDRTSVVGSKAFDNRDGVDLQGASERVRSVEAFGNTFEGISFFNASGRIESSVASGNREDGIAVSGGPVSITSTEASGNRSTGIEIHGGPASITSVRADGNVVDGIYTFGAAVRVRSSVASGNGTDGFLLQSTSVTVTRSRATGDGLNGIGVASDHATIVSSNASGNGANGIATNGDAPTIGRTRHQRASMENHTDGNGFASVDGVGAGIDATGFTTPPSGRNEASGNDDPNECEPTTLC